VWSAAKLSRKEYHLLDMGIDGNSAKMDPTEMVYEHVDWMYLA
jgi:hypothetical protein